MFPYKFEATEKGTADFWVDGENFVVAVQSIEDCHAISRMLDLAYSQGRAFAAFSMWSAITKTADDERRKLEDMGGGNEWAQ